MEDVIHRYIPEAKELRRIVVFKQTPTRYYLDLDIPSMDDSIRKDLIRLFEMCARGDYRNQMEDYVKSLSLLFTFYANEHAAIWCNAAEDSKNIIRAKALLLGLVVEEEVPNRFLIATTNTTAGGYKAYVDRMAPLYESVRELQGETTISPIDSRQEKFRQRILGALRANEVLDYTIPVADHARFNSWRDHHGFDR